MYKIFLKNVTNKYEYEELAKTFLRPHEYEVLCGVEGEGENCEIVIEQSDKNVIKHELFKQLSLLTGLIPDWGILTGVRPVKLAGEIIEKKRSSEKAFKELVEFYLLNEAKSRLIIETFLYQQEFLPKSPNSALGIYLGIPFCPTRCLYCSFTSNQGSEEQIEAYLEALYKEIDYVSENMKKQGMYGESIYIGGGTPTAISPKQLEELLKKVSNSFANEGLREFTVEAGRPDTITKEKLEIIKAYGGDRISINPQSIHDRTLNLIGRAHSGYEIIKAFEMAKDCGISIINADVIAGLPEETPRDFEETLNTIINLGAENITVHTLAVKRASRLIDIDKEYHYKQGEVVREMLTIAEDLMKKNKYKPYYLYRQKHMTGGFENIGYCKVGTENIYNVRIMEEKQTILALGAGGISKVYYPKENRLERIANVSNYEIYIERLLEMLKRKEDNLFSLKVLNS